MPSSRATVATGRPVLITSFTASSLYSGVNPRRVRPMMNIPSYEVSTQRGHGHAPPAVSVYYDNCTAVRAAGADPMSTGDPGYSRKLDRDGDGVACE